MNCHGITKEKEILLEEKKEILRIIKEQRKKLEQEAKNYDIKALSILRKKQFVLIMALIESSLRKNHKKKRNYYKEEYKRTKVLIKSIQLELKN